MFLQSEVLSVSSISSSASRDYTQLGMESLLKLKRTYINRFEYEKAKMVQAVINERKIEDINGITQECIDKIDKKITETEIDLQRKRELIISKYKFKELDILEKIDNAFEIVQERHVEEMATIEKQKALGYVRAIHKPIKESRELLAQSKRLAENDDFDGAVRIREQSRKVKEEIIQNRKEQVNQKYELMRRQLYSKQKNDLKILQDKLASALDKNESLKIENLKTHDKLARCTIILHQQKILGEMSQKIKSKDKRLAMSDQINRFFNQRIAQFNEKIEQANKEVLKSQSQASQTSEVDFFMSGEESAITTDDINQINNEIKNISADFENLSPNTDNLSEESNPSIKNINFNDELVSNNSDNNFEDNLENNDFDAIDNNLQLDDVQTENQNPLNEDNQINEIENNENVSIKSSDMIPENFEEEDTSIKNNEIQIDAEDEPINSDQSQNIIYNSLQEEEEEIQSEKIQNEEIQNEEMQNEEMQNEDMQNEEEEMQCDEEGKLNEEEEGQNDELNPSVKSDQLFEHQNQYELQAVYPSPDFSEPSNLENTNQLEQNNSASVKNDENSLNQDE